MQSIVVALLADDYSRSREGDTSCVFSTNAILAAECPHRSKCKCDAATSEIGCCCSCLTWLHVLCFATHLSCIERPAGTWQFETYPS